MDKKTRVAELNDQIDALASERDALEKHNYDIAVLGLSREIGRTFVYRSSCYSCPEKPEDYWDVFRRVVAITKNDSLAVVTYQECYIDSNDEAVIKRSTSFVYESQLPSIFNKQWKRCRASEFQRNWNKALASIGETELKEKD